jgi:hypothetical protein
MRGPSVPNLTSAAEQVKSSPVDLEAVEAFRTLVEALGRKDYRAATSARRRLYALGYSVVPRGQGGRA